MPENGGLQSVDITTITDPDVRRALRGMIQLNQQLQQQVKQQQQEIEALLHMMIEKHVGSVGEFKRHMLKLQQGEARSERIHGQITATAGTATPAQHPPRPTPQFAEPEIDRPRRYSL